MPTRHLRVDRLPQTGEDPARHLVLQARINQTCATLFIAGEQIVRNCHGGKNAELLMDQGHAMRLGVPRRMKPDIHTVADNTPLVGRHLAREDFHQRRLSRAVFAEKHIHLAVMSLKSTPSSALMPPKPFVIPNACTAIAGSGQAFGLAMSQGRRIAVHALFPLMRTAALIDNASYFFSISVQGSS